VYDRLAVSPESSLQAHIGRSTQVGTRPSPEIIHSQGSAPAVRL
jgi:hypothetical protein